MHPFGPTGPDSAYVRIAIASDQFHADSVTPDGFPRWVRICRLNGGSGVIMCFPVEPKLRGPILLVDNLLHGQSGYASVDKQFCTANIYEVRKARNKAKSWGDAFVAIVKPGQVVVSTVLPDNTRIVYLNTNGEIIRFFIDDDVFQYL
jgi:hypothetical protein